MKNEKKKKMKKVVEIRSVDNELARGFIVEDNDNQKTIKDFLEGYNVTDIDKFFLNHKLVMNHSNNPDDEQLDVLVPLTKRIEDLPFTPVLLSKLHPGDIMGVVLHCMLRCRREV
jgi:hypothetical protein